MPSHRKPTSPKPPRRGYFSNGGWQFVLIFVILVTIGVIWVVSATR